jgi:hypothetical protein
MLISIKKSVFIYETSLPSALFIVIKILWFSSNFLKDLLVSLNLISYTKEWNLKIFITFKSFKKDLSLFFDDNIIIYIFYFLLIS